MAALYLERLMNFGMTPQELRSGRPIIGIAQSGSDLSPCNRIHLELAKRVRDGIRDAGGIALEFPTHPIQETCRRPTAAIDRNLSFMTLVEILHGYPIDAVVLTTGCDRPRRPLAAASTVDIPAINAFERPMLDGGMKASSQGPAPWSGAWQARGRRNHDRRVHGHGLRLAPSAGHYNTMGTASTMNAVAGALNVAARMPAIPAPYRGAESYDRKTHYRDGVKTHAVVILTRARSQRDGNGRRHGGSTNAQPHISAMASTRMSCSASRLGHGL
jgi:dihydroxy-acid dehydratase